MPLEEADGAVVELARMCPDTKAARAPAGIHEVTADDVTSSRRSWQAELPVSTNARRVKSIGVKHHSTGLLGVPRETGPKLVAAHRASSDTSQELVVDEGGLAMPAAEHATTGVAGGVD